MIKNFIFDLGNVIVEFDKEKIIEKCTPLSKKNCGFFTLKEKIFSDKILLWDAGLVSTEEIVRLTCNDLIESGKSHLVPYCLDVFNLWFETLEVDYQMLRLVENLHSKGYGCYALSNVSENFEIIEPKISGYFDGIMLSYQEKLLKPGLEIYKHLLYVYDLKPEECFFIDDTEKNVIAAQKLNIEGYRFTGYSDLVSKLNEMGITI